MAYHRLVEELASFILNAEEQEKIKKSSLWDSDALAQALMAVHRAGEVELTILLTQETGIPADKLHQLLASLHMCLVLGLTIPTMELLFRSGVYSPEQLAGMNLVELYRTLSETAHQSKGRLAGAPSIRQLKSWQKVLTVEPDSTPNDTSASAAYVQTLIAGTLELQRQRRWETLEQVLRMTGSAFAVILLAFNVMMIGKWAWMILQIWPLSSNIELKIRLGTEMLKNILISVGALDVSTATSVIMLFIGIAIAYAMYAYASYYLSKLFHNRIVARHKDPVQILHYFSIQKAYESERKSLTKISSFIFGTLVILFAIWGIAFLALSITQGNEFQFDLYSFTANLTWLVAGFFTWLLLEIAGYMVRVFQKQGIEETASPSSGLEMEILGSLSQGALVVVWVSVLFAGLAPLIPWIFRVGSLVQYAVNNLNAYFDPRDLMPVLDLESLQTLGWVLDRCVLSPGLYACLVIIVLLILISQPRQRIAIYSSVMVFGSLGIEKLSEGGLELWRTHMPEPMVWVARMAIILVMCTGLDFVVGLVVHRSARKAISHWGFPGWGSKATRIVGASFFVFGVFATAGLIPGASEPAVFPAPEIHASKGAVQDEHGTWMVRLPAGTFTLGGSDPQTVTIPLLFFVDMTEVTNKQYAECVRAGDCKPPEPFSSQWRASYYGSSFYSEYPVAGVRYRDAQAYCKWQGERLLTDLEWQFAAQGSDGRLYPWGNQFVAYKHANVCDRACEDWWQETKDDKIVDVFGRTFNEVGAWNYTMLWDSALDDGYPYTAPVGAHPDGASPFGVLDMVGNVAEWVDGGQLRGGSFGHSFKESNASVYNTACLDSDSRCSRNTMGFRCATEELP